MSELYPLLLRPEFHERPWGARDLAPIYDKKAGANPIGEAWLTGDGCRIANGPLAGMSLGEAAQRFGVDLVGEDAPQRDRFPLLIKFLFPREKLSVQVHPDDAMARRLGLPNGKTECWFVLAAEPGAQVGLGLKPGTTKEDFARAIREVRAEELLNWIDIHPGEMIYVDAGTVHAIGPGSVLVETQQNSDSTYRLYDYGRGRELHIEQGLEALKEKTAAGKMKPEGDKGLTALMVSSSFIVLRMESDRIGYLKDGLSVLVGLSGSGVVGTTTGEAPLGRGDAVVVPAASTAAHIEPKGKLECLWMSLPPSGMFPPDTVLAGS